MEHTKLLMTTWFLAIYLISRAKTGLSALALMRQLGVSYPTAWLLHHRINRAMAARENCHGFEGAGLVHASHLGGERAGGKRGRGYPLPHIGEGLTRGLNTCLLQTVSRRGSMPKTGGVIEQTSPHGRKPMNCFATAAASDTSVWPFPQRWCTFLPRLTRS